MVLMGVWREKQMDAELSFPVFFLHPLPLFYRFLFFTYSLHQNAIIQDISEEELKALTVEEGPRVLSESHHTHTHTHAWTILYSRGEEVVKRSYCRY